MAFVNHPPGPGHIPYLLELAIRRMQQDLHTIVGSAGFPHLRGSHFRILSMIPPEGARPSALADVAQITRPALGELVAHLRTHGYVTTTADASDGRAVLVRLTRRGKRAADEANQGVEELKRQWSAEVGSDRLEAMLEVLAALTLPGQPAGDVDGDAP